MYHYIIMLTFSFERQQAVTSKIHVVPYRLCEHIKIVISSGQKQFLSPAECVQYTLGRFSWNCSDAHRATVRNSGMFTFPVQVKKLSFRLLPHEEAACS